MVSWWTELSVDTDVVLAWQHTSFRLVMMSKGYVIMSHMLHHPDEGQYRLIKSANLHKKAICWEVITAKAVTAWIQSENWARTAQQHSSSITSTTKKYLGDNSQAASGRYPNNILGPSCLTCAELSIHWEETKSRETTILDCQHTPRSRKYTALKTPALLLLHLHATGRPENVYNINLTLSYASSFLTFSQVKSGSSRPKWP